MFVVGVGLGCLKLFEAGEVSPGELKLGRGTQALNRRALTDRSLTGVCGLDQVQALLGLVQRARFQRAVGPGVGVVAEVEKSHDWLAVLLLMIKKRLIRKIVGWVTQERFIVGPTGLAARTAE